MITPVSFEISKLLRSTNITYSNRPKKCYDNGKLKNTPSFQMGSMSDYGDRFYLAPTIAEVCMYLYEKHGIWIYPKMSFNIINNEAFDSFTPVIEKRDDFVIDNIGKFNSPTEAYSKAIEYTLKELING